MVTFLVISIIVLYILGAWTMNQAMEFMGDTDEEAYRLPKNYHNVVVWGWPAVALYLLIRGSA